MQGDGASPLYVDDLAKLAEAPADEAHDTLTALHGIGPWTADIYLLFCLGHSDAWPAGDLAVQEAVRIGLGLKSRPTVKEPGGRIVAPRRTCSGPTTRW